MKQIKFILVTLLIFSMAFLSCSDDDSLKSTEKEIIEFSINNVKGIIDQAAHTIGVTLPYGASANALTPQIKVSEKAKVVPTSGKEQNFSQPILYTVTAEDGSKQDYTVTVVILKNTVAKITALEITNLTPKVTAAIDEDAKVITATVPFGTDLKTLVPHITFEGKEISPVTDKATDFTQPVKYTVTADNGDTQKYTVTIKVLQSSEAQIEKFNVRIADDNYNVFATVNEEAKTITAEMTFGTDLTRLVPTIVFKGKTISPKSGLVNDFSSPVVYTVTAMDGTKVEYTVTITRASASTEKELISYTLNDGTYTQGELTVITGVLNPNTNTMQVDMPYGTDITKLTSEIKYKGVSISPKSGVTHNFKDVHQLFYTIKAQDGSDYQFSVMVGINPFQPKISKINRTSFTRGDRIVISGSFIGTGTEVELRSPSNAPVFPEVTYDFKTQISAIIPDLAGYGDQYTLTVKSGGGNVRYEESKITIMDKADIRPEILSITPASFMRGMQDKIYLKTKNIKNLDGKYATMHYVVNGVDKTINAGLDPNGDENDIILTIWQDWKPGKYKLYLERDGIKSNEVDFELLQNIYPQGTISSISTYTPVAGETITMTGANFLAKSDFKPYIEIRKIMSPGQSIPTSKAEVTILNDNTLTFTLPFIKASGHTAGEIDGNVGISLWVNGQSTFHQPDFKVTEK